MYRAPWAKLMNSSSPKMRFNPSASSTSSAPLTRPSTSWDSSWSIRPLPRSGAVRSRRPRGARGLRAGPGQPARWNSVLTSSQVGANSSVPGAVDTTSRYPNWASPPRGAAAPGRGLVGGQPLHDVERDQRLVVAVPDGHVALGQADLEPLHGLAE